MNNIVCVTSPVSVGCTFIDWSIHFLAGKNKFYSTKDSSWIQLSIDPISKTNAHGHKKNHPSGKDKSWQCANKLASVSNTELLSFYPFSLHADLAGRELNIFDNLDTEKYIQIQKYQQDDYEKMINLFIDSDIKVVYVSLSKHNILYTAHHRAFERLFFLDKLANTVLPVTDHINQVFFADSISHWTQSGLVDIWDERERAALCIRPFDTSILMEDLKINRSQQYCQIDAQSMWYNGKNTIKKIMKFLNIRIDDSVWNQWVNIYYKWQQIHLDILEFDNNLDHIINSIVNDWYYEIDNLTFKQEIIIQHLLIYKHGLNFKTWQLEKLPLNTQDLHKLLEPNIHLIPTIYRR